MLPFADAVESLLRTPDAQPLTFHRRVTRPVSRFIAAVALALRLKVCVVATRSRHRSLVC